MKEISKDNFSEELNRTDAVLRARNIFIKSGITNNVSVAFELYQSIFAEQERKIFLSTVVAGNRNKTIMDRYERPKCPECGADMMFRKVSDNPDGTKVQLVCQKPDCDTVLNSENDLDWWMKELKKKDGSDAIPKGTEEVQQAG